GGTRPAADEPAGSRAGSGDHEGPLLFAGRRGEAARRIAPVATGDAEPAAAAVPALEPSVAVRLGIGTHLWRVAFTQAPPAVMIGPRRASGRKPDVEAHIDLRAHTSGLRLDARQDDASTLAGKWGGRHDAPDPLAS